MLSTGSTAYTYSVSSMTTTCYASVIMNGFYNQLQCRATTLPASMRVYVYSVSSISRDTTSGYANSGFVISSTSSTYKSLNYVTGMYGALIASSGSTGTAGAFTLQCMNSGDRLADAAGLAIAIIIIIILIPLICIIVIIIIICCCCCGAAAAARRAQKQAAMNAQNNAPQPDQQTVVVVGGGQQMMQPGQPMMMSQPGQPMMQPGQPMYGAQPQPVVINT